MIQTTNAQNPYRVCRCERPAPTVYTDYNAVKIAINGAAVNAPSANAQFPGRNHANATQFPNGNTSGQGMTQYYDYPQANLYEYPQAGQQGYYAPVENAPFAYAPAAEDVIRNYCTCPVCGNVIPSEAITSQQMMAEVPQPQMVIQNPVSAPVIQPQVMQQNINSAAASAPAPVITEAKKADNKEKIENTAEKAEAYQESPKVDVQKPEELKPQMDINEFIAELTNPDFNKQAMAMEAIAILSKQDPEQASELLDERVIKALNEILTADTKDLIGPTKEQTEARIKIMQGKTVTDAEKELANTMTPLEQAERNKSYSLFTLAILEKNFSNEVEKLSGQVVPFKDLPGINSVVEQMSANPNPMVRASAVESLSYIQRDEYKDDLNALFKIALNDSDKTVKNRAEVALNKLDK